MTAQLVFFPETAEDRSHRLEIEVQKLREQCEKLRKGQYAKISEISKVCNETKNELEALKGALCRNQFNIINST